MLSANDREDVAMVVNDGNEKRSALRGNDGSCLRQFLERMTPLKTRSSALDTVVWLILLLVAIPAALNAQSIFVPLNHSVYGFLDRLTTKGTISLHDEVLPMTRVYIAGKLKELELRRQELNYVEREELDWYDREFSAENGKPPAKERYYLLRYSDSLFSVRANPIIGTGVTLKGNAGGYEKWWGGYVYGSYGNWFSAHLDFRDMGEYGNNFDSAKQFTPRRGYWINYVPAQGRGIEYSDVKGSIAVSWSWGSVALIKDDIRWGHGQFGQLILSDKPPSYPQFRLFLQPVEWLRFYYIHGWLASNVPDSNSFYIANSTAGHDPVVRKRYIDKYIAANLLTISVNPSLDLSLGNSAIYSDPSIRPEYLIPFLLYKFQDHNAGRDNDNGNNGQMFVDVRWKPASSTSVYSTLFIDMVDTNELLKGDTKNLFAGLTLGGRFTDVAIENLDCTVEYTRVLPWVYEHYIPATTYKNLDFTLGHWIGQNADQARFQLDYRPLRGLKVSGYAESLRKGGLKDVYLGAYTQNVGESFPYEPLRKDLHIGVEGSYELYHDLLFRGFVQYSKVSDQDPVRTPAIDLGEKLSLGFYISYSL